MSSISKWEAQHSNPAASIATEIYKKNTIYIGGKILDYSPIITFKYDMNFCLDRFQIKVLMLSDQQKYRICKFVLVYNKNIFVKFGLHCS